MADRILKICPLLPQIERKFLMTVVFYDCDVNKVLVEVPVLRVCSHDGRSKWLSWEQLKKLHVNNNLQVVRYVFFVMDPYRLGEFGVIQA